MVVSSSKQLRRRYATSKNYDNDANEKDKDVTDDPAVMTASEAKNLQRSNHDGPVKISYSVLVLAAAPLLGIAAICLYLELEDMSQAIWIGSIRAFIQLSLLGTILYPIFTWGQKHAYVVVVYSTLMIVLAAQEVDSRAQFAFEGQFWFILASLLVTISLVAAFTFKVVLHLQPWHTPRYVIPITGMLLGNSINGITLSINAIARAIVEESDEIELLMSFGATPFEALQRVLVLAISAGSSPVLTMLRVTGIISIPGMMTGQLLGGTSTVQASRYQLLILYLIAICTLGVILLQTINCALFVGIDRSTHMLAVERFKPKKSNNSKVGALLGLVTSLLAIFGMSNGSAVTPPVTNPNTSMNAPTGVIEIESVSSHRQESTALLEVRGISRTTQDRLLFANIALRVDQGDLVFIKGPSGAGKSQLMRIIASLTPADRTSSSFMALKGTDWGQHSSSRGHYIPRHIGDDKSVTCRKAKSKSLAHRQNLLTESLPFIHGSSNDKGASWMAANAHRPQMKCCQPLQICWRLGDCNQQTRS